MLIGALSMLGGVLAALTHAATVDQEFGLQMLWQPSVVQLALMGGAAGGVIMAPLMVWAFWRRSLATGVPVIYAFSVLVVALLNVLHAPRSLLLGFALVAAFVFAYGLLGAKDGPTG